MKFIHLSDLHIGQSNNTAKVKKIIDGIINKQDKHQCNSIVITGDIVDDGEMWQYREAKKIKKDLEKKNFAVIMIPGNHDYGSNGIFESEKSQRLFHDILGINNEYPRVDFDNDNIPEIAFISLDSMEQEMIDWEFWGAQGEIGKVQLMELDYLLDELKNNQNIKKIVLGLHHHPFYFNRCLALRDSKELKNVVGKNDEHKKKRIDCLIFGHKHSQKRFNDKDNNKEKKYGIPMIYASHKSTDIVAGNKGQAVYEIGMIDLGTNKVSSIEINA